MFNMAMLNRTGKMPQTDIFYLITALLPFCFTEMQVLSDFVRFCALVCMEVWLCLLRMRLARMGLTCDLFPPPPARSRGPDAHIQCPRRHRHHGLRHPGPRPQSGPAAAQRRRFRHPQPAHHRQDGRHQQGLRQPLRPAAGHLIRDVRLGAVCPAAALTEAATCDLWGS